MIQAFFGELLALVFVGASSGLAVATGIAFLLFPEMGALAYDTCRRPDGVWARAAASIFLAPTVGAIIGTLISRELAPGLLAIALCIGISIVLLRLARSPMAPAVSAAYLPLALHVGSWLYPASIAGVTAALALLVVARRRLAGLQAPPAAAPAPAGDVDDILESLPRRWGWAVALAVFVPMAYGVASLTGLPLVLFPPLVVIAYEMFAHPDACPWARRPVIFPAACIAGASLGLLAVLYLGVGPLSTVVSLAMGIVVLRTLKIHMPPVLGIGLLPQVLPPESWRFVLAIAIGALMLSLFFLAIRPLLRPGSKQVRKVSFGN